MYTNILVPYDKSEPARHALSAALDMAKGEEPARITVLNVTDVMDFDDVTFEVAARVAGIPPISDDDARKAREKYFQVHRDEITADIEEVGFDVPGNVELSIECVGGHPQEAIRDYVKGHDFDCIVMGRRGLGAIRGTLGSVSYSVLRSVELPMLIVK